MFTFATYAAFSKRKFLFLCPVTPFLKAVLSCRAAWTPVCFPSGQRNPRTCRRLPEPLVWNVIGPSECERSPESLLHNISVREVLNCQVRTNLSASVRKALGGLFCKVVSVRLLVLASQVVPLEKQFWKLNRQGRRHVHRSFSSFPASV